MKRNPNTVTIIATVRNGAEGELSDYLKLSVDPGAAGSNGDIDFTKMGSVHFFSMFIVDRDERLNKSAILVLEATIDGSTKDFLEEMLDVAPVAFNQIFSHCEGFPPSSMKLKRLVVDYLLLRSVPHKAHHCGYHGRTVSQIIGEQNLRNGVTKELDQINLNTTPTVPTAQQIQRKVKSSVRADEKLSWAVQRAARPRTIMFRKANIAYMVAFVLLIPIIFAAIWMYRTTAISPVGMWNQIHHCVQAAGLFSVSEAMQNSCNIMRITSFGAWLDEWSGNRLSNLNSLIAIFIITVIKWYFIGLLQKWVDKHRETARKSFLNEAANLACLLISYLLLALLTLVGVLIVFKTQDYIGLFSPLTGYWQLVGIAIGFALLVTIFGFFKSGARANAVVYEPRADTDVKIKRYVGSLFGTISTGLYYLSALCLFLTFIIIGFWFVEQFANILQKFWNLFFGAFALTLHQVQFAGMFDQLTAWIYVAGIKLVVLGLTVLPFLLLGILLVAVLVVLMLLIARILEFGEQNSYQNCNTLVGRKNDYAKEIYAREEHGYNTNQNHLASVVHVKPGIIRLAILRFVFWVIEIAAFYIFNLGLLGGIPTILSARWVLIDNGKRVIFMTNYVGAWDSYINEFSDLEGVRGVNAIWSNTALPDPDNKDAKLINFPLSSFLLWKGAENDIQFKSFIRASQVETLVWYSAYPDLSVSNINNNSALRNNLFEELTTPQLDELAKRL